MSYKLDFSVTYHFGRSTCNSGPFLLKIGLKCVYLQGEPCNGSNRFEPVFIGPVLIGFSNFESSNCNWKSGFLQSSPVSVRFFSGPMDWTFKHYPH